MDLQNASHRLGFIAALIIIVALATVFFMNKKDASNENTNTSTPSAELNASTPLPNVAITAPRATGAVLKTSMGEIEVAFFRTEAPKTVENFEKLARGGFYTNTKFHRVIKSFMIQAGDPFSREDSFKAQWGTGGPGYTFEDEINSHKIVRGVLAMANAGPGTNGSQFFIVTAQATPWLDGKHTVFGKVVRGMDTVDKIDNTPTGERDIPKTPIVIESITLR